MPKTTTKPRPTFTNKSYALEKFFVAAQSLVDTRPIQERLAAACMHSLIRLTGPHLKSFPKSLQGDFATFWEAVTNKPAKNDEGTITATCMAMTEEHATKLAKDIIGMFYGIADGHYD